METRSLIWPVEVMLTWLSCLNHGSLKSCDSWWVSPLPSSQMSASFEFRKGQKKKKSTFWSFQRKWDWVWTWPRWPQLISWNFVVIDRFIEKYGTHIVVGLSVGGQDVLLVRQDKSSSMGPSELKQHIEELGDQLFTGSCTFSPIHAKSKEHNKNKVFLFPTAYVH